MIPAVVGDTTPSIAEASSGSSNWYGPELPGDVDVVGIARAPRRHDRDVVEAVCPTGLLAASDLYFHRGILAVAADEKTPRAAGPKGVSAGRRAGHVERCQPSCIRA